MQGTIFNIQHFSIHDGPGIRTTVFFKGCNLKCAWCHNPESQSAIPELMFHEKKCIGCGACVDICERKARRIANGQLIHLYDICTNCGKCAEVCYSKALEIIGQKYTDEDVMEEVMKDTHLYNNSGGGVTFSGGEAMLQIDFLEELLKKCKAMEVSTAVDTAGNIPWKYFQRILPYTDLFLYDLKSMDCNQHQKFTGVDNGRILTNLNKLKKNSPIWVRIPCIKNVNDSDKEIEAYCRYLQHADNIQRIELIPYHSYGEHKYKMLGKSVQNFMPMDKQTSQVLQKKLEAQGFQVINYC